MSNTNELSETDLFVSTDTTDVHIEQVDLYESFNIKLPEEHSDSDIPESPIQQTDILENHSDSSTSPIIDLPLIKSEKRFSVVNRYSIPSNTIVSHMSCSLTWIYICTNQRTLLYAKFSVNDRNLPLQWYRYPEPAERIIVSLSNQTIWRSFSKHLCSSMDAINFPPMGTQWRGMKFSRGQSLLSIAINDQCGW